MRRLLPCVLLVLALAAGRLAANTVTLTAVADTTLLEENPDASNAKGSGFFTGRITLTFIRRALVRFDLSAIPAGSVINSARLDLTLTRARGNPVDVSIFLATAPWDEGTSDAGLPGGSGAGATPGDATWTKRIWPGTAWATPGGDTASSPSATSPIPATILGPYSWGPNAAMASDVQGWLDNPATNFGWQVRGDELQAAPSARRWGSRESVDPSERPHLAITFTPPGGGGGPRPVDDVPALSARGVLALAAALALAGALALRRSA